MVKKNIFQVLAMGMMLIICLSSCTSYKNVAYFKDFEDTAHYSNVKMAAFKSPRIQPDDLLNITIQTIDPEITKILNAANTVSPGVGASSTITVGQQQVVTGYLVDKNGEVEIPFAGKIKLQGYTTVEAREIVREAISKYVKDPIVNIKFSNFRVTVLGEVAKPATYIIPNEKVSVLDALGLAGDLTIYGRRENVLLIRDSAYDQKSMVHLNLNTKEVIASPYYYLQPNDIIYVEPNESKAASVDAIRNRNITIFASALSVILVLVLQL